jgi:hypothetical protein
VPIKNLPGGIEIISGHCGQSLKVFFGSAWDRLLMNRAISTVVGKKIRIAEHVLKQIDGQQSRQCAPRFDSVLPDFRRAVAGLNVNEFPVIWCRIYQQFCCSTEK